ncbi:MAG: hypothetical protein ACI9D5_002727 [Candidatus Endobugula sp.]|jgi:hypothetical protein
MSNTSPEQLTQQWFETVVLGLNLCPFAHRPARAQQIRFSCSISTSEKALSAQLIEEIRYLELTPSDECETTLFIVAMALADFYDYQFFLDEANRKLKQHQWQGVFQLASFHPDYCFAGAEPSDASNLTNRSPYPIIHILRESSLTDTIEKVDNPGDIPRINIEKMQSLSSAEKNVLFPHLKKQ